MGVLMVYEGMDTSPATEREHRLDLMDDFVLSLSYHPFISAYSLRVHCSTSTGRPDSYTNASSTLVSSSDHRPLGLSRLPRTVSSTQTCREPLPHGHHEPAPMPALLPPSFQAVTIGHLALQGSLGPSAPPGSDIATPYAALWPSSFR
ncbi:hypothetical protein DPX16_5677 [Anabarilius grahami]|uniref:Uncharacterized protein n=1 Tax=Anabarilius grahami TaxID=495550 RepID=A0A3N0YQ22_ANAGA|nr:hypothetical protein DPX16_5677 [Anabarilius grahami]